ncbi:cation diffusion facilitator family transporter [Sinanaerobacter chloroacetimidivorans]|uniref:Cation transporter n=1 Tax=Sinanaerobacter chloroacetimidivorans TaxID=2818044 RepID=A0A8J7VZT0_9FIRM|nr:cation diffusion facilitator family transporter [Sinanaerobacter chloroacetimidivorans]MBR0597726.1 cation transporter [Sinanaerobacter chloroacetimidivorans]
MRKLLIRLFIKNHEDIKDPKVRENYGKLAGMVGIVTNALLCALKLGVGFLTNSIAIIADGINNLADASSSVITLIGFKMASKPSDEEHPYGHARIEYLTGLFVSILIILLGIKLLTSSFEKVISPDPLEFKYITIVILAFAIGVKIWQSRFNIKTGEDIRSSTLKATGVDSRNDVIATSAVLLSILIGRFTGIQLDGYMGCIVALFIIYSGIQLIGETSSPLLGKAPDPELVEEIQSRICEESGVLGIHDLVVHDYGPGRIFASVHVEVDAYGDLIESHDMIDRIERIISQELKIHLVVHMDPLETKDPLTIQLNQFIDETLKDVEGVIGIHDLRVVAGYTHSNVIFDIVISPECKKTEAHIRGIVENELSKLGKEYFAVITFDKSYVSNNI